MQVLKTLKKFAAIGTGAVMLGATLTGALALDLKEYPSPYVKSGVYGDDNVFVYGDAAAADDTMAAMDIAANFQFLAKTPVVSAGTTVSVTGGKSETVPLGAGFSNATYFDTTLQDDDISTLFDGKVNFQGADYDTSEELQFCDKSEPSVVTSLMSDDDYKRNVFFEMGKDSMRYAYNFDKTINVSTATISQPLEISFLGKTLKIYSVATAGTTFSAKVGTEYLMKEGDEVTVEGKVVKLEAVGTSNAQLTVDGQAKSITTATSTSFPGLEIYVDSVTSKTNFGESSAILVMGKDAIETYADGDAFVGENVDDPNWVWDIAGMSTSGTTTSISCDAAAADALVLRVENEFTMNDDTDAPTAVGKCIDLPNGYLSVCLDSLTVADTGYKEYDFEFDTDFDSSVAKCLTTGVFDTDTPSIHVKSVGLSEGLDLRTYTDSTSVIGNVTTNQKTDEIWLVSSLDACDNATVVGDWLNVFYQPTEAGSKVAYFGAINNSAAFDGSTIAKSLFLLSNGNSKDANLKVGVATVQTPTINWSLQLVADADTDADLIGGVETVEMQWGLSSSLIDSLGDDRNTEEAEELQWAPGTGKVWSTRTNIGTKDEDHMTGYGIIIVDPKGQSSSDRVKLLVPDDQVFANIVLKGSSATVTSGSTSYVPTKITPVYMKASEVSDPTKFNLIVVGGPCANSLAGSLFDKTCDGWDLKEGEAVVKLVKNGEKVAMLVAGTTALDTQRAGRAVANSDKYAFAGTEKLVKGTTLQDITVE